MIYLIVILMVLIIIIIGYCFAYYPRQLVKEMPLRVEVFTPNEEIDYYNDCLHPCIRKMADGRFAMVQSPWYNFNDHTENPLFYISDNNICWNNGIEMSSSPTIGYNSDPNVFVEDGKIFVLWREYNTPKCRESNCVTALFIRSSVDDGDTFSEPILLIKNIVEDFSVDTLMCPILMKHKGKYRIYSTWYQFEPSKKNLGVAIWEGTSLSAPDFTLKCLTPIKPVCTVDKWHQLSVFRHLYFFPIPHRYDLWHFDLFEYEKKLYMVSCEDKTDNIMLGVSEDYIHFRTCRIPLINAHYMENSVLYRQKYYKPTAYIDGDRLHLFYTSNAENDYRKNVLWMVSTDMRELKI